MHAYATLPTVGGLFRQHASHVAHRKLDKLPCASNAQRKLEADARAELVEAGRQLKEAVAAAEARLGVLEEALQREGQRLPNLTHPDVPVGGEEAAAVLMEVGGVGGGWVAWWWSDRTV